MSKFIKLENVKEAFAENCIVSSRESAEEIVRVLGAIKQRIADLPSIEVSEDCISRKRLFDKAERTFDELGEDYDINHMLRDIKDAPSVILLQDDVVMERLDFVKKIIETHIDEAPSGIFFIRNFVGDRMVHLDRRFGIDIEICYEYEYFEIFGLTDHEQKIIESFYDRLNAAIKRGEEE